MTQAARPVHERLMSRSLLLKTLIPLALVLVGTGGYALIEGWHWFDGLYMTLITLSTIGYGETHELSRAGRVFTIFLILSGVFTFAYVASGFARSVVNGELRAIWGKQQMANLLAELKDHILVCGYGRVGRLVCHEFSKEGVPFVIIDSSAAALEDFKMKHGIAVVGDATSDEVLKEAGIDRARGLVTVMRGDSDNLFTTMSARLLNDKLYIVARMDEAHSEKKLLRAGASRVVSPYHIGSGRVVQAMLRPTVVDFIELATGAEHIEIQMEEIQLTANSALAGRTLRDSRVRSDFKVIIVAIKKLSGEMLFNPEPDATLEAKDIVVVMGSKEQLTRLEELAKGPEKSSS